MDIQINKPLEKNKTPLPIVQANVCLNDKNWFKTGGNACYFSTPTTSAEFQACLAYATDNKLPIFVLGSGANILISDEGFDGLVIKPGLVDVQETAVDTTTTLVTAGAGITINDLIEYCLEHNLLGLEEFSGIPGTVGGSTYINIHYYDFCLADFITGGQIIDKKTGLVHDVDHAWFNFGYDHSKLFAGEQYLVSATFKVKNAAALETAYAQGRRTEIIRHRVKRYPSANTCGSFFRNFHDNEVTLASNGKKMIYAAYYLDKLGIKGTLQVGDAIVSHQHANMFVNKGNATSHDITQLARTIQQLSHQEFGIIPQPECQLIGFKEYPLLS